MRFIFLAVFVLLTIFSFAQSSSPEATDPIDSMFKKRFPKVYAEIGHPYPDFEIKNQNKTLNNDSLQGKVVLINFWFEGCLPCMAEMEALNQLSEKLKDHKDFMFISVSKDNAEAIKRVKKKYGLSFDAFSVDEKECKQLIFGSGYPTSIVLDKSGIIKYIHVGGPIEKDGASERIMDVLLPEIETLF